MENYRRQLIASEVISGFLAINNIKNSVLMFLCVAMLLSNGISGAETINNQEVKAAQEAMLSGNYEKAFAQYSLSAKKDNNPLAQFSLGLFYQNGWGREADAITACQWFERAALGGIPTSQHLIGICLEEGVHRPEDYSAAAVWFEKAAQGGHHHSYCHLGNLYMTGKGVLKDPIRALELCYRAAQQSVVPAQVWMGKFYLEGDVAIRDDNEAYRWFEAAAQKNAPEAFYYLGIIISKDLSEEHMSQKARKLFEQAAALKHVPAYFQVGKLFYYSALNRKTNQLSAEDLAKAYLWLSATVQRSQEPLELVESKKILEQISTVMPKTWVPELDLKVAHHLSE